MRIAFNAAVAAHPLTGVARYAFELAAGLRDLGVDLEYWTWNRLRPALAEILGPGAPVWTFPSLAGLGPRLLPSVRCAVRRVRAWHFPNGDLLPCTAHRTAMVHDMAPFLFPDHNPPALGEFYRERTRRIVRGCSAIAVNSRTTLTDLVEAFPSCRDRVFLTPLGTDHLRGTSGSAPLPGGLSPGYLLAVGTVEPRKNLRMLVEAYASVPGLPRLVICGGPGYRSEEIESLPAALGISDRVVFTGYVGEDVLSALYDGAAALVHPAVYEGFGLPLVEAMRRGLPVAASDNSALKEMFGGLYIPLDPGDGDSVSEALRKVAGAGRDPVLDARRREVLSGLTWRRCAEATLEMFESLD